MIQLVQLISDKFGIPMEQIIAQLEMENAGGGGGQGTPRKPRQIAPSGGQMAGRDASLYNQ